MKKIFLLLLLSSISLLELYAQTITPARTGEYCPGVNTTFTVTIAGQSVQSVSPKALNVNPTVVQQPFNISVSGGTVTFSFVGRFADNNNKQTFTVNFTNSSGQASTYDFTFIKIKSLLTANSFSQIYPTPTSITAQRCQTQNFNISFPNVQYGNPWEAPPIGYGTVTNYEYLLPVGWKIGTTTSSGSNWIPGGNNMTVTSDLSNGVNGAIRIRPVNTACGSGLQPGQEATVAISRPAPTLSISGTNTICSGTSSYTINGVPSGATVQWSLSNTTDASISGCSTCSTVTVSKSTTANTIVKLSATVTDCTGSYTPVSYDITLGKPLPQNLQFPLADPIMGKLQARVDPVNGATGYKWYIDGQLFTYPGGGTGSNLIQFNIARTCDVWYNIAVEVVNACGTSAQTQNWAYVPCDNYYMVSPNPATTEVIVSSDETKTFKGTAATIDEVRIYDLQGNLKRYQKYSKVKQAKVNVTGLSNGTYFIEIINGTYNEKKQLLIKN